MYLSFEIICAFIFCNFLVNRHFSILTNPQNKLYRMKKDFNKVNRTNLMKRYYEGINNQVLEYLSVDL